MSTTKEKLRVDNDTAFIHDMLDRIRYLAADKKGRFGAVIDACAGSAMNTVNDLRLQGGLEEIQRT